MFSHGASVFLALLVAFEVSQAAATAAGVPATSATMRAGRATSSNS